MYYTDVPPPNLVISQAIGTNFKSAGLSERRIWGQYLQHLNRALGATSMSCSFLLEFNCTEISFTLLTKSGLLHVHILLSQCKGIIFTWGQASGMIQPIKVARIYPDHWVIDTAGETQNCYEHIIYSVYNSNHRLKDRQAALDGPSSIFLILLLIVPKNKKKRKKRRRKEQNRGRENWMKAFHALTGSGGGRRVTVGRHECMYVESEVLTWAENSSNKEERRLMGSLPLSTA